MTCLSLSAIQILDLTPLRPAAWQLCPWPIPVHVVTVKRPRFADKMRNDEPRFRGASANYAVLNWGKRARHCRSEVGAVQPNEGLRGPLIALIDTWNVDRAIVSGNGGVILPRNALGCFGPDPRPPWPTHNGAELANAMASLASSTALANPRYRPQERDVLTKIAINPPTAQASQPPWKPSDTSVATLRGLQPLMRREGAMSHRCAPCRTNTNVSSQYRER